MVDWANFTNVLTQSMELVKVIHLLDGFFVWQYFRTLSFEIDYYRGRRRLTPSFVLYVFCRVLTFTSVFLQLVGFNLISEFDCRAWYRSVIFFSYAAVASGLAIFIALLFKLWGHKLIIILPIILWLSLIALMLRDVARADSTWIGLIGQCSPGDTAGSRNTAIIWLIVTIVLAGSIMLGLYTKKNSLGKPQRHAYEKAVLWVSIPVLMQSIAVIFLSLNLNVLHVQRRCIAMLFLSHILTSGNIAPILEFRISAVVAQ
ncbi:hypothetical protein BDQ12DRAFT_737416 [Crucibulum laeve]|uniref:Uncharacterized protein n=1 Tax=Crucibulum laeve TaxID=68775 RepID=A0A5C3LUS1_9AGAR|nr:hypothetical protein BDQ12DRAFT_737416 [Crucibulum laeve]